MVPQIDSHHHLWRYEKKAFEWLQGELAVLRRDFTTDDLLLPIKSAGVDGTVVVQARQSEAETEFLLDVVRSVPEVWGVVGWLPIASEEFDEVLERYGSEPWLKGLRHIVQAEEPGFLDGEAFNAGIAMLQATKLAYDVLIVEGQMEEATRFVDRHPKQSFVLDHLAKPRIAEGAIKVWEKKLREIARREHVTCKVSGLTTEAGVKGWTEEQLRPYFEVALDAFGPGRLMIGTDWPVLLAGCSYEGWWEMVRSWAGRLSDDEKSAVLGGTAARIYQLSNQSCRAQYEARPEAAR